MRLSRFYDNIQRDMKLFTFVLFLLCFYRVAGGVMLLSFVTTTLPELIVPRLQLRRLRLIWGTLVSFVLAVLFMARFPYYAEFGQTYGMQVMQGWHDDRTALFWTMVQEYGLPWRLALAGHRPYGRLLVCLAGPAPATWDLAAAAAGFAGQAGGVYRAVGSGTGFFHSLCALRRRF